MRLVSVLPLLATMLTTQASAATPHRSAMPAFWRFVKAAEKVPEEQGPVLFREQVVAAHPELYVSAALGDATKNPARWDARTLDSWKRVKPLLPQVRAIEQELATAIVEAETLFRQHLPDFKEPVQVWIVPSRLDFDGTLREVGDDPALMFAPDGIVAIHGEKARGRIRPLVLHEFFHVAHELREDDPDVLLLLWREGLATYFSHVLLPKASLEDVLSSKELAKLPSAEEARLAREALASLGDRGVARGHFFNYSLTPLAPGIPPRAGYLLGYRVAQRLARTRTLEALARLERSELEPLVREALQELARSGQAPAAPGTVAR